ncbi:MAG: Gldg family protein [Alphaproteobacteria bacterium]|nr:Gldg family protein [Alphaproteobacteria bacterium]MBL7096961.1 Gldg family protein [Alphaproteobacteria bacterium]
MAPLSRRTYAVAALVLAAIGFVCLNIVASAWITTAQIDLTENGQFTLADGTRNIIAKIPEPITLKFYFSKKIAADYAQTRAYADRVHDLLQEYAALSHGRIVLQEIDPEPFTPEEDEATGAGLTGAPTDAGETVYFGLVGTNRIDGKEVIPYFTSEREPFLEFDLSTLIYHLSQPEKPVLGIVSGLPLAGGGGGMAAMLGGGGAQPYAIYTELQQTYTTQMIEPSANAIPANVSVLMVVHPSSFSAAMLYAIDQFVLKGGHALVFVDPDSELSMGGGMGDGGNPQSDLPQLFHAWGIGYAPGKVIADAKLAQRVQVSSDPRNPVATYPIWLHVTQDQFDRKDLVTANLQAINLASAGALQGLRGASTSFIPLVKSSDEASLLDTESVRFNPRPQDLLGMIRPTGTQFVIAARVSGPAKTAYENGPPAPMTTAGQPPPPKLPPQVKQSIGPINVIVMADTDIFDDRFWVRVENVYGKQVATPFADNGAFVLNAIENLMGSSDLISLRTRATNDRPFTVVKEMQAAAQADFQAEAEALQARMTAVQQRLHELEQGGGAGAGKTSAGLTDAQQAEIDRFKKELLETRRQLRDVQHRLRSDVDTLGDILAFLNIALVPLLVAGFALTLAWLRRRRRARALATA